MKTPLVLIIVEAFGIAARSLAVSTEQSAGQTEQATEPIISLGEPVYVHNFKQIARQGNPLLQYRKR